MTNPIIDECGNQRWYIENDKLHRLDGPAIVYSAQACSEWLGLGQYSWCINDKRYYDNKSFQEAANLSDEDMTAIILKYGNI